MWGVVLYVCCVCVCDIDTYIVGWITLDVSCMSGYGEIRVRGHMSKMTCVCVCGVYIRMCRWQGCTYNK